ncbi:MAG: AMP-binding protein [Pseudomonadota bacterium]
MTAIEMMDFFVASQPDAPALSDEGRELSYREVNSEAERLASALRGIGVGEEDRVAIITLNRVEQLTLIYATMKIGAVYVPINNKLAPPEIKYVLQNAGAKVLFAEEEPFRTVVDALEGLPQLRHYVLIDGKSGSGWIGWDDFIGESGASIEPLEYSPTRPVYQMYTSGTTGFPKGVVITQQQLATFVVQASLIPPQPPQGACYLTVAPLFHAAALCSCVSALCLGRSSHIVKEFNPLHFVETIAARGISNTTVVPAMLQAILATVPNLESYDFSCLEKIVYGASPITEDLLRKSMDVFDCDFQQGYGMTELVAMVTALTAADHRAALAGRPELLRSCGRPGPFTKLKIVDPETRVELARGEVGEIAIKSTAMMECYGGMPEKTAEVIDGTWYYSGDGGYLDEEGYLYIKDRIKDMIITGGENVYPAEVENALASHSAIADVAVIGLPDDKFGSAVVAVAVAAENSSIPSTEELIEFCRPLIASFKIPRRYEFVDELPRNASGKLLKNKLRSDFAEGD